MARKTKTAPSLDELKELYASARQVEASLKKSINKAAKKVLKSRYQGRGYIAEHFAGELYIGISTKTYGKDPHKNEKANSKTIEIAGTPPLHCTLFYARGEFSKETAPDIAGQILEAFVNELKAQTKDKN